MPLAKQANRPADLGKAAETGIRPATQWPCWETGSTIRERRSEATAGIAVEAARTDVPRKNADAMLIGAERAKQGSALFHA